MSGTLTQVRMPIVGRETGLVRLYRVNKNIIEAGQVVEMRPGVDLEKQFGPRVASYLSEQKVFADGRVDFGKLKDIEVRYLLELGISTRADQSWGDSYILDEIAQSMGRVLPEDCLESRYKDPQGVAEAVSFLFPQDGGPDITTWNLAKDRLAGKGVCRIDLEGADLSNREFIGADFSAVNFKGSDFRNSSLMFANFDHADLKEANFSGANLERAEFSSNTMLTGSIFNWKCLGFLNLQNEEVAILGELDKLNIRFSGEVFNVIMEFYNPPQRGHGYSDYHKSAVEALGKLDISGIKMREEGIVFPLLEFKSYEDTSYEQRWYDDGQVFIRFIKPLDGDNYIGVLEVDKGPVTYSNYYGWVDPD